MPKNWLQPAKTKRLSEPKRYGTDWSNYAHCVRKHGGVVLDLHYHILPEVDDGAASLDEALAILYPRGCDFALQPEFQSLFFENLFCVIGYFRIHSE